MSVPRRASSLADQFAFFGPPEEIHDDDGNAIGTRADFAPRAPSTRWTTNDRRGWRPASPPERSAALRPARLPTARRGCSRERAPSSTRRRTTDSPTRGDPDLGEPPGESEGDRPDLTFSRFHELTAGLEDSARLELFLLLDEAVQGIFWDALARGQS
jgi:hypothetical protein